MELKLRNKEKSRKIEIDYSILSIQYNDESIINNLIEDYEITVIDNKDDFFIGNTVIDEISTYTNYPELSIVSDIMQVLELPRDFFDREIKTLSRTERIHLNLLRNIGCLGNIILFKDIFLGLDLKNQKNYIKLFNYLKNTNHLVIICSSEVDYLYNLAEYSVIENKSVIKFETTYNIYTDVPTLIKNKLEVPTLSYITYKAKEDKNVKLFYSKDVRDIIKDIYKHV
jgi:energy-coupling factor transporter ATP-binding protein EcfA2